ncbi:MAG TPA: TlpA disulfide reductase family protein [Ferruginibacter sp.]|jgi:thiol-disulfide isomerase/thioredoxin|nr:TlpA disulfide reductase family protein [Ferruginibacter sp.]
MKKLILSLLILSIAQLSFAQEDTSFNFLRYTSIPAFEIAKAPDSVIVTNKEVVKRGHPFMLVFFSPDCEHCQKETKEFLAYKKELKDVQVLMVSPMPYEHIKQFYKDYSIDSLPNFTIGQDWAYHLGNKLRPHFFPTILLYDKVGNYITGFTGNVAIPKILEAFNKK